MGYFISQDDFSFIALQATRLGVLGFPMADTRPKVVQRENTTGWSPI